MARSIPKALTPLSVSTARMSKFTPDELAVIGGAYHALLSEPWFNRNAITERELLKLLMSAFREDPASCEELLARCAGEAEHRFGRRR